MLRGLGLVFVLGATLPPSAAPPPAGTPWRRDLRPLDTLRHFTPDQRAWFGRSVAVALDALQQGMTAAGVGPCRLLDEGPDRSPSDPASLASESGGRSALCAQVPTEWGASAECGGRLFSLRLSPVPADRTEPLAGRPDRPPVHLVSRGEGWEFLRVGDGERMRPVLLVGAILSGLPEGCPPLGRYPAPLSVALEGAPDEQRVLPELVSPALLAAALERQPAPARPAPPSLRALTRRQLEAEVYDAVLRSAFVPAGPLAVVHGVTLRRQLTPDTVEALQNILGGGLQPGVVADFAEIARAAHLFPPAGAVPGSRRLEVLDPPKWAALFGRWEPPDDAGLRAFAASHGDVPLIALSAVGFSTDHRQALVELGDYRTRARTLIAFERLATGWVPIFSVPG